MISMKGRFLKKLKCFPSIITLKHGLVSQLNTSEMLFNPNLHIPSPYIKGDQKTNSLLEAGKVGESEHFSEMKDGVLKEKIELDVIVPPAVSNDKLPIMDVAETAVSSGITMEHETANGAGKHVEEYPVSLSAFEEKCPPGGRESIVLYTTSLRSIRKTFEDCHSIRFLLESFKVLFYERDVSLHMEFREELWKTLGGKQIPPRLFVRGRYIGGADEVVTLHEQGKLKKLLEGIPLNLSNYPCTGCGNMRFLVCFSCNGSIKVLAEGDNSEQRIRCPDCNENGLVKCPICTPNSTSL